jgi:hypothetical protein
MDLMHAQIHKTQIDSNGALVFSASMWTSAASRTAGDTPWRETFVLTMKRMKRQYVTNGSGQYKRVSDGGFENPPNVGPMDTQIDYVKRQVDRDMVQEIKGTMLDYMDSVAREGIPPADRIERRPRGQAKDIRRLRPATVRALDRTNQDFTR